MNSCQKLHIIYQSTYFIDYFIQGIIKNPRVKKIHQILERITRIYEKVKIICVLYSHELLCTKIYYTSIFIFYVLFTSRQVPESKNYQNTSNISKVIKKT